MSVSYRTTKAACYYAYLSMSSVFCVPPLLFMTFHERYQVSYTLLGTLVLINFFTQLGIDLIFTFFSKYFPIKRVVTLMPFLTAFGLTLYALIPTFFPSFAYAGLVIGTVFFSVSAGLSEVLLSPIIAAIPSEHPERDMSLLHSLYAWGVLLMVLISTAFLRLFGTHNWMYLILFLAVLPIGAGILFACSRMPELNLSGETAGASMKKHFGGLALCVLCIFLGSATENVMTNWISGYMESALRISKEWCDVIGLAAFAMLLGGVRTWFAGYGKHIMRVMMIGMAGSFVCYLTAGLSGAVWLSAIACVLTGAFCAMLWPGTLIMMEENMPALGVTAYALMASGGDFGASVAPQLVGVITDTVSASSFAARFAASHAMTPDQVGLKVSMLISALFPLLGFLVLCVIARYFAGKKADKDKGAEVKS